MVDYKQETSEEAGALRVKAVQAFGEQDVGAMAAIESLGGWDTTIEDARGLQAHASVALAQAIDERDVAIDALTHASGREAVAREDAREQHAEAISAQASAIRASGIADVAIENAREQHVEAIAAQAEAANMNTLRHLATVRADSEALGGNRARFVLYLLSGIILVMLVMIVWLLSTR